MTLGGPVLTAAHVLISLIAIALGFVVIRGLIAAQRLDRLTALFLGFTIATSVTGFIFFPFKGVTPGIVIGAISLAVLAVTVVARYPMAMAGPWRAAYVVMAVIAQYLNFFVLIVQSFLKIPVLHNLAPTGFEAPFVVAQGIALIAFITLGALAVRGFHLATAAAA